MSRKPRSKVQDTVRSNGVDKPGTQAWAWILLAATVIFIAAVRIRLLQTPLERDEGEFGYMGHLILKGIPPYKIACNMKLPGTYVMYALFLKVFGNTVAGVHLGLLVMNAISIVLVFILAKRMLGPLAAVAASAAFGLMSVSPSVLGTSAHATQYILPFALGGILLMLKAADSGKPGTLVLAGLLLGMSFLMKQHAMFFLLFAIFYYVWGQARRIPLGKLATRTVLFSSAMVIPYGITCLVLYKLGVFDKFWFWTYTYSRAYTTELNLATGSDCFSWEMERVLTHSTWLWMLGGVGLTAVVWGKKARTNGVFLIGFLVFSWLTVCPGMYFRQHYFVTFLPALAIMIGAAVSCGTEVLRKARIYRALPVILFIMLISHFIFVEREFLFEVTPDRASIMMYKDSTFIVMKKVAEYIKAHSKSTDKLVMFGSEPEMYFYTQRASGTTFIYTYGLVEVHNYASRMQREMMNEIIESQPEFIVISNLSGSWTARPKCDETIFLWASRYFPKHYDTVGIAEFVSKDFTAYIWGADAASFVPRSQSYLTILRKRPSPAS